MAVGAACSKPAPEKRVVVTVSLSEAAVTKTYTENGHKPLWHAGDQIWLSDGSNSTTISVPASGEGKESFSFDLPGELDVEAALRAVYPAAAAAPSGAPAAATVGQPHAPAVIPLVQDGSFAQANICTAEATAEEPHSLSFRNATAVLKFTTAATPTIRTIQLLPLDADIRIMTSATARTEYYVAVPPAAFKAGSKIVFLTDDKYCTKTTTVDNNLEINKIYTIDLDAAGLVFDTDLWQTVGGSLQLATINVGASGASDPGLYADYETASTTTFWQGAHVPSNAELGTIDTNFVSAPSIPYAGAYIGNTLYCEGEEAYLWGREVRPSDPTLGSVLTINLAASDHSVDGLPKDYKTTIRLVRDQAD